MSTIKLKRSATPGKVPTTSALELGELAINTYDGKVYIKKDVSGTESVVEVGAFGVANEIQNNVRDVTTFTYTVSSANTVSGADDNGATLDYTVGKLDVFYNGVKLLANTDYTATDGSSISFTEDVTGVIEAVAQKQISFVLKGGTTALEDSIKVDSFTGNGSNTQYTLSTEPFNENFVIVTINGVTQHVSEYSVTGQTLTFTTAPANDDDIEVRQVEYRTSTVSWHDYKTYTYTANNETSFSGADDNGNTLDYIVDLVEVYGNGVRLVNGSDFTATTGSSITLTEALTGVVEVVSLASATFAAQDVMSANSESLANTSTDQVVDSFNATTYRSAKYLVQMTQGTDYQVSEVLVLHDGANTYMTEYGQMYTNAVLGTISSDVTGGYCRLLVTPVTANTDINTNRISVVTA